MFDKSKLDNFPELPGVYLMKGAQGVILYVGKAKNLRKRVRSYFGKSGESRYHIQFLLTRITDIEYIVTDTEKEALILENTLIKNHHPRYNMNLRDDKTYFSLRMDMKEEFPRLSIIRKVVRDGARYFGPYSSAAAAREVLKQLNRIFPLRHYPLETCRRRKRPCLYHQLGQCSAPCHGLISREDYAALAEGASLFLAGKNSDLLKLYKKKMAEAAAVERFEEAARYRDLIQSIEVTVEKQKMVTRGGDADIVGIYREGTNLSISLLFIRGGNLIGSRNFEFTWEMNDSEAISSFLNEYYNQDVFIPDEVLIPLPVTDGEAMCELLAEKRGKRTALSFPRRGTKAELVKLADKNAETSFHEKLEKAAGTDAALAELQERLNLKAPPRRIECYDISNIQGRFAVGSKVAFLDGKADRRNYRSYRIRTVSRADDFAMMHEVLSRRFRRGLAESDLPDLIVVDGGIGQLNILMAILEELDVKGVDAASLAKSRVERDMTGDRLKRSDERVFLPGRKNPVVLRQNSAPLLLLAQIRDEAHRFAISYHQKLRGKGATASRLDAIPDIGPKRKKELLRHFGSLKKLMTASSDELAALSSIPPKLAKTIWEALHEPE